MKRYPIGKAWFPRKCSQCEKPFNTQVTEARFCSTVCRVRWHRARRQTPQRAV